MLQLFVTIYFPFYYQLNYYGISYEDHENKGDEGVLYHHQLYSWHIYSIFSSLLSKSPVDIVLFSYTWLTRDCVIGEKTSSMQIGFSSCICNHMNGWWPAVSRHMQEDFQVGQHMHGTIYLFSNENRTYQLILLHISNSKSILPYPPN